MANEVIFPFIAGQLTYFLVFNEKNGQVWNTSGTGAFEAYLSANYGVYAISATQQGSSPFYEGNFPTAIPAGAYGVIARNQTGGSASEGDATVAAGKIDWNGSATLPLSDMATSGQVGSIGPIRVARGVAIPNFLFKLVSSLDHNTPFTSGLVSGQILRDNGTFGSLQSGAASGGVGYTEKGNGWYSLIGLTSGDLLANTAALTFFATGVSGGTSDARDFAFVLQRVSGSI